MVSNVAELYGSHLQLAASSTCTRPPVTLSRLRCVYLSIPPYVPHSHHSTISQTLPTDFAPSISALAAHHPSQPAPVLLSSGISNSASGYLQPSRPPPACAPSDNESALCAMTSRPGPGIPESLQHRGGGSAYAPARRAANPQHGQQDSTADLDRPPLEDRMTKPRYKAKPIPLEAIQTSTSDFVRPAPRGKPQLFFSNPGAGGLDFPPNGQHVSSLPVPPRPGSSMPGGALQQPRIAPGGSGVKSDATVKLQGNDAPAPALVFPGGSE